MGAYAPLRKDIAERCVPHSSTACRLSSHHQAIFTEKVAHRNKDAPSRHDTDGARGETRTHTLLPTADFESAASANSATRARHGVNSSIWRSYCSARISTSSMVRRISLSSQPRPATLASPIWLSNGSQRTPSHGGVSSASNRLLATMRQGSRLPK